MVVPETEGPSVAQRTMSSVAPPGRGAERRHSWPTPDARRLERSPGWRPLQRGVRRHVSDGPAKAPQRRAELAPSRRLSRWILALLTDRCGWREGLRQAPPANAAR